MNDKVLCRSPFNPSEADICRTLPKIRIPAHISRSRKGSGLRPDEKKHIRRLGTACRTKARRFFDPWEPRNTYGAEKDEPVSGRDKYSERDTDDNFISKISGIRKSIEAEDDDDYFEKALEEYMREIENDPNDEEDRYFEDVDSPGSFQDDSTDFSEKDDSFGFSPDDSWDEHFDSDSDDGFNLFGDDDSFGGINPFGRIGPFDSSDPSGSSDPFGEGIEFDESCLEAKNDQPVKVQNIDDLIGLDNIKDTLKSIASTYIFEHKIASRDDDPAGLNIMLLGNPGTAKTTVARSFARYLEEAGIIPEGSFKELKKSDFVGQFVGHTEKKIDQIFEKNAKGAVLLWDEIYALAGDQRTAYDEQAVTSILQNMENYRETIINIFVGYEKPMRRFLDANQGLRSRITDTIYFEDLDDATLAKIFCSFAEKKGIHTADGCSAILEKYFADTKEIEKDHFGNGRTARNLFNIAFRNLAKRLEYKYAEDEQLIMTEEDVGNAIAESLEEARRISGNDSRPETHIGFAP